MGQLIAIVAAVALIAGAIAWGVAPKPDPVKKARSDAATATLAALDAKATAKAADEAAKEAVGRATAAAKAAGE